MKRRVVFHPLLRVELVQMLRHGQVREAIRLAGEELRAAYQDDDSGGDDGEGGRGGLIMVPTRRRAIERGYAIGEPVKPHKTKSHEIGGMQR